MVLRQLILIYNPLAAWQQWSSYARCWKDQLLMDTTYLSLNAVFKCWNKKKQAVINDLLEIFINVVLDKHFKNLG